MKFCRVICQKYFIFPVLKFEITFFILYVFYFFTSIFKPFYTFQQVLLFTSISPFLTHSHSYYPFNYFRKPIRYKPELGLRLRSENMRYAAELSKGVVLVPRVGTNFGTNQGNNFRIFTWNTAKPGWLSIKSHQNTFITLLMTIKYQTHRFHRPFRTLKIWWKLTEYSVEFKTAELVPPHWGGGM